MTFQYRALMVCSESLLGSWFIALFLWKWQTFLKKDAFFLSLRGQNCGWKFRLWKRATLENLAFVPPVFLFLNGTVLVSSVLKANEMTQEQLTWHLTAFLKLIMFI